MSKYDGFARIYPPDEHALRANLRDLMTRWKASLPPDDREAFVSDGFYPNYTRQRCRILFIGREAYGDGGWDYIDTFLPKYQGREPLEEAGGWFHQRLLKVAWGLLKRVADWDALPQPPALAPHFGKPETEGGFSFAFMNANKLCNPASTATDWRAFGRFVPPSAAFIREEISLLHPDVIISMNMNEQASYENALGFRYDHHVDDAGNVAIHHLPDGTPFLDVWHFSASKSPSTNIYAPIVQALQLPEINLW